MVAVSDWLAVTPAGLYCRPGGFHIDPSRPQERAVVTHGHGDHARPRNAHVLATPETIAIMQSRYGAEAGGTLQALGCGETVRIGDVDLRFAPAGHVLGSAQAILEHGGQRVIVSGDYKRRADPTCPPFEVVEADVFITEATFALPVFRHPPIAGELQKLFASLQQFPSRTHLLGAYALGKAQRLIAEMRGMGYDRPIYLHGALEGLCALYREHGVALGELRPATVSRGDKLEGEIVLAPPSATKDRWSRRFADPVVAAASGWMRVRQRARQGQVELPMVISDHADWEELTRTLDEVGAPEVWVTHGREDALVHWANARGYEARALSLLGRDEEAAH